MTENKEGNAQIHGEKQRPVAYYAKTLPLIVRGMVACVRAVAAAAIIVEKYKRLYRDIP